MNPFTDKAAVRSDAAAELDRLTRGAQKKPNSGNNSLDNNINSTSECWRMACKEEKEGDGVSSLYLLLCASKKKKKNYLWSNGFRCTTNQKEPFEKYEMQICRKMSS